MNGLRLIAPECYWEWTDPGFLAKDCVLVVARAFPCFVFAQQMESSGHVTNGFG